MFPSGSNGNRESGGARTTDQAGARPNQTHLCVFCGGGKACDIMLHSKLIYSPNHHQHHRSDGAEESCTPYNTHASLAPISEQRGYGLGGMTSPRRNSNSLSQAVHAS